MEKERTTITDDDQTLVDEKAKELLEVLSEVTLRNMPEKAGAVFYSMAFLSTVNQTVASLLQAASRIVYDGLEKSEKMKE